MMIKHHSIVHSDTSVNDLDLHSRSQLVESVETFSHALPNFSINFDEVWSAALTSWLVQVHDKPFHTIDIQGR